MLDADWTNERVRAFLIAHGLSDAKALDWMPNSFIIPTKPTIHETLDLANKLAIHEGVAIASPNWLLQLDKM